MTSRIFTPTLRALRARPIATIPITPRFFSTTSPRMTVHNIATKDQFKEVIAREPVVLLDAFATWCGPCKAVAPIIAKWAESEEFKDKIYFAKFDVDALPELAQELGIRAMPTFIVFKDGDKVGEHMGSNPGPILALLQKWNGSA
ncbi:thioredoxin-like protein [Podospora aff. communis PSN243]|uniref:Thioredoxin-like protein n=1 Tax=Podospora aff. communis PSN243 TaxID=3040156 RepID=A0AAV9GQB5_9PEZI|nr:thioredoxin-like protein [Podospora aff. communis PSN243]